MIKRFIVYDADGNILRTGYAPEGAFELQAQEGEFITEGIANDRVDKIDRRTNRVVRKEAHEIERDPLEIEFDRLPRDFDRTR